MAIGHLDLPPAVKGYSLTAAYGFAQLCALAHQPQADITTTAARGGFPRIRHYDGAFDTQGFTVASDKMIVTVFRATENMQDWDTNLHIALVAAPGGTGRVHEGFSRSLGAVWPQVLDALGEFRDNGQSVWFAGHSLGGALAHLAAFRYATEGGAGVPDGVYTYGQPRTGDAAFAEAYGQLFPPGRIVRFVNNDDIVPHVPSVPYVHTGTMKYIDAKGRVQDSLPLLKLIADRFRHTPRHLVVHPGAPDGIKGHAIAYYLDGISQSIDARRVRGA